MKRTISSLILMVFMSTILLLCTKTNDKKPIISPVRAVKGDTVWVVINTIKSDKCQQFEKFFTEIVGPEFNKSLPPEKRIRNSTRMLYPTEPNEDGTFTYLILIDPALTGSDYTLDDRLKEIYGNEKAIEYLKMLDETFDKPQKLIKLIQN